MTPKEAFSISGMVSDVFTRTGVFSADGNWADPMPPQAVVRAIAEIEQSLGSVGISVPEAITQYFKLAGFIAPMIHG